MAIISPPPWSVQTIRSGVDLPELLTDTAESREVSWALTYSDLWPVIERAGRYGPLPVVGTHSWLDLPAGEPRKVGAVHLAAVWMALQMELDQEARADALQEVSAGADWRAVGKFGRERAAFEAANPWAKRVVA